MIWSKPCLSWQKHTVKKNTDIQDRDKLTLQKIKRMSWQLQTVNTFADCQDIWRRSRKWQMVITWLNCQNSCKLFFPVEIKFFCGSVQWSEVQCNSMQQSVYVYFFFKFSNIFFSWHRALFKPIFPQCFTHKDEKNTFIYMRK